MPRGRAATYDDQRERILRHAAALFAERGYAATSMNQVAAACGVSKATLYHYHADKYGLLLGIADEHVSRLVALVDERPPGPRLRGEARLRELIQHIVAAYAGAQHAHRVLTEDVKFLNDADRQRVLDKERRIVEGFAKAVAQARGSRSSAPLAKPLTMLLFGMVNWMFTWMQPDGEIDHAAMGPIVADLFLGGVSQVRLPRRRRAAARLP